VPEANAARSHGFVWWPIVVGISRGATDARDGHINASTMIQQAPAYGVRKSDPVFCDLEPDALHADYGGALAMANAFRADMHAAGYGRAYVYSTASPLTDWLADWTNIRPSSLPAGKVGVQYGGGLVYDLSVFDPALLPAPPDPPDPQPATEVDMFICTVAPDTLPPGVTQPGDFLVASNTVKHIVDPRSLQSYLKINIPFITITYAEFITYANVTQ
jgi:hypothetical protein